MLAAFLRTGSHDRVDEVALWVRLFSFWGPKCDCETERVLCEHAHECAPTCSCWTPLPLCKTSILSIADSLTFKSLQYDPNCFKAWSPNSPTAVHPYKSKVCSLADALAILPTPASVMLVHPIMISSCSHRRSKTLDIFTTFKDSAWGKRRKFSAERFCARAASAKIIPRNVTFSSCQHPDAMTVRATSSRLVQ